MTGKSKEDKMRSHSQSDKKKGEVNDKKGKRDQKAQRKKGMPKWKNVVAEIENLKKRLEKEVPPSGVLYYKYKHPQVGEDEVKTN